MIDLDGFWALIDEAKSKTTRLSEIPNWLVGYLKHKPVPEIRDFEERAMELRVRAYDARLWGAAYLLMNGCGDDTFVDFRDWLICQGRRIYVQALDAPDILADIDTTNGDHGRPLLFAFGSVAMKAHMEKTGSPRVPVDFSKYSNPPLLHPEYNEADSDPAKLALTFPKLYARFKQRQERCNADPVFKPVK